MEKLLKNGVRTASETELVLVDGGCPLPWCPGYDGDRNDRGGIMEDGIGWQYNY